MKQPDHHSVAEESYRSTGMYDLRYWCSTHYPQKKRLDVLSAKVPWQSLSNTLLGSPDTCLDGSRYSPTEWCHLYTELYPHCPAPATHRQQYIQGMSLQALRFVFRPLGNCSWQLKDELNTFSLRPVFTLLHFISPIHDKGNILHTIQIATFHKADCFWNYFPTYW